MNVVKEALVGKGYVKLASISHSDEQMINRYAESIRTSPHYADHALLYEDGQCLVYARKVPDEVGHMQYRSTIIDRLDRQTSKGLAKYGSMLHDNPLNAMQRLEYLAEELTDGLQYIEHLKRGVTEVFDRLADIVARTMTVSSRVDDAEVREALVDIAGDANSLLGVVMGYAEDEQGRS